MTCRQIDDLMSLVEPNPARMPEAIEHLCKCAYCRSLVRVLDEGRKSEAPPRIQLERIQARMVADLKPVRPLPSSRLLLLACAIIFLSIVAIGASPFGMTGWGSLSMAQRITVFATLGASAILLAVSMVGQMAPGSKYAQAPATLLIAILSALMIVIAARFNPRTEPAFVADGLACMKNGLTYSIPAAFLFWMLARRGAMLFPKLIGAAAGGLAGLIGFTVLEINCSNLNVYHVLVWHWGVIMLCSAAGGLIGAGVEYIERSRNQKAA